MPHQQLSICIIQAAKAMQPFTFDQIAYGGSKGLTRPITYSPEMIGTDMSGIQLRGAQSGDVGCSQTISWRQTPAREALPVGDGLNACDAPNAGNA